MKKMRGKVKSPLKTFKVILASSYFSLAENEALGCLSELWKADSITIWKGKDTSRVILTFKSSLRMKMFLNINITAKVQLW